jgi:hypothetical protein
MEDIPQATPLLVFTQESSSSDGELSKMTFESYRERKIMATMILLPDWWRIPLPLIHIKDDSVSLNEAALTMIPSGAKSITPQIDKALTERIIIINKDKRDERTYSLLPLSGNTFFVEDISGDFEMAEDLVWWAAIGRAFVSRMGDNGLLVKRLSPYETPPQEAVEVIPCSWEGELVGRLAIELPPKSAENADIPPDADAVSDAGIISEKEITSEISLSDETPEEISISDESPKGDKKRKKEKPVSSVIVTPEEESQLLSAEPIAAKEPTPNDKRKSPRKGKDTRLAPPEVPPPPIELTAESFERAEETADSIKKNAARKAYGGKKQSAAARAKTTPAASKTPKTPKEGASPRRTRRKAAQADEPAE